MRKIRLKIKGFLAAGAVLCLLGGCGKDTPTDYQLGKESLEKGNYTEAIEYFQGAVEADDHTLESWRGIGISWTEQGVFDKAQEAFETAAEFAEKSSRAMQTDIFLYLADAKYQQGDYEGCIETCTELLKRQRVKDAYFLRGSAYLYQDEYKKAANNFAKVISGSEDYADYLDIYRVYLACDMNADGEEYLESALEITAKDPEDYYNKGRIYYYLEEYENAQKELEKALEEEYAQAAVYLGKVYMASGDTENAEKMFQQCLKEDGLKAEGYNGLAYCAAQAQDYDSALEYIAKGLEEKDGRTEQALLFNEIVLYEKKSDYDSAKQKMSEYLEMYPADESAVRENYFLQTR